MKKIIHAILAMCVCASVSEAQTLTQTYVQLADSADFYMKRQRWADAERCITEALRHEPANPSNWLLWSNLGVVRTHQEKMEDALQAYEIGLAGAPRSTVLLSNRAWTRLMKGDDKEALADLDATLTLDSLQSWPLKMRGLLKMRKADLSGALTDLRGSDSISPGDPAVLAAIGDIHAAEGDTGKAVDMYERSLRAEQDPDVEYRLLLILTEKDNSNATRQRTVAALGRWPKHPGLHLVRALQHRLTYQNEPAEAEKKLALQYGADPLSVERVLGDTDRKRRLF